MFIFFKREEKEKEETIENKEWSDLKENSLLTNIPRAFIEEKIDDQFVQVNVSNEQGFRRFMVKDSITIHEMEEIIIMYPYGFCQEINFLMNCKLEDNRKHI